MDNTTLFTSITMLCVTDNILRNIPSFMLIVGNILHNIVSPIEHCYGSELYYERRRAICKISKNNQNCITFPKQANMLLF